LEYSIYIKDEEYVMPRGKPKKKAKKQGEAL
jgi:hypothetical protein